MARARAEGSGVLAVTVLTSLDQKDLFSIGVAGTLGSQVDRLASLSAQQGAEGVICSPQEVPIVKNASSDLLAVTPGIRTSGDDADDQKRTSTPGAAMELGADLLVVGRSITAAEDPVAVAAEINASLPDYPR
jgi:orotidine-5'-phosphate decarboxylase